MVIKPGQALGFPRADLSPFPPAISQPTPLPKRPKGRWFIGIILIALCGVVAYTVWGSFFRYQAYGTVTGHLVQVSPAWEGELRYLQVREGDRVQQGQLLFSVDNIELRQRHAQLGDELRMAQAALEGETARLKWQSAFGIDQGNGAMTNYYQAWGNLLRDQAKLDDLRIQLRRGEILWESRAIAKQELDQLRYATEGQSKLVAKLKESLAELKERATQADALLKKNAKLNAGLQETGYEQLKPQLSKIEALQAERSRIQERLDKGQVRTPASGLVVKVLHFPGERCKAGEPIVSMLEEGSLEVVLYMPQDSSGVLAAGEEVKVSLDPYPEPLTCRVLRLGDQFEPAPEHIKRHYREGQRLLPVYLQPSSEASRWMALRVGGVVKLPYFRATDGEKSHE